VPADRLLVETDAPAMPLPPELDHFPLPPAPGGERINHPASLAASRRAGSTTRSGAARVAAHSAAGAAAAQ